MKTFAPLFKNLRRQAFILALLLGILFSVLPPSFSTPQPQTQDQFLILTIDNKIIGPVVADYIDKGITKAEDDGYQGVIIILDTPGGLLESTRAIVKKIMNASIPIITYIAPSGSRAGSAGVFITLASHVAAMAPSTNIGAAHPVGVDGEKGEDRPLKKAIEELTETLRSQKKQKISPRTKEKQSPQNEEASASQAGNVMEDKVLNDTVAWVETIAKNRKRNVEWAKEAVLKSVSATEKEAMDKGIIDFIAADTNDLLKKLDGRQIVIADNKTVILNTKNALLHRTNLTTRQNILNTLINPNIAYILMMIGFLGLFIEITHPGVIFPGVAGVISLVMAFYAFAILPVNFAGFLLIGLAIILFIAEALTPATFGLLTLAGIVSMLLGSLMLIDSSFSGLTISLNIILPLVLAVAAIAIFLVTNVVRAHRRKIMTGAESLPGTEGKAGTDMAPDAEGQVFVNGEIWSAINKGPLPIAKDEKIKVIGIDKVKLLVTK
ncbi:MAG: nodulation protein NfeD [Candidatus Velamenicoccus archaeovorus]